MLVQMHIYFFIEQLKYALSVAKVVRGVDHFIQATVYNYTPVYYRYFVVVFYSIYVHTKIENSYCTIYTIQCQITASDIYFCIGWCYSMMPPSECPK